MLKRILITCGLIFTLTQAHSQTIDIGRAVVTLPSDGQWTEITQAKADQNYGGEVSGTTTADIKTYLLTDANNQWLALLTIRASKSTMSEGTMSWTGGCKPVGTAAIYDLTNGSHSRLDCLRVFKNINVQAIVADKSYTAIKASLESKNITLSGAAYLIQHSVGTQSGTFVVANAIVSHRALQNTKGAAQGEPFAGQPGVAWGHLMAEQSRDSANSIRGRMSVPSLK